MRKDATSPNRHSVEVSEHENVVVELEPIAEIPMAAASDKSKSVLVSRCFWLFAPPS